MVEEIDPCLVDKIQYDVCEVDNPYKSGVKELDCPWYVKCEALRAVLSVSVKTFHAQTFPKKYFPVSPRTHIKLLSVNPSNNLSVLLIKS